MVFVVDAGGDEPSRPTHCLRPAGSVAKHRPEVVGHFAIGAVGERLNAAQLRQVVARRQLVHVRVYRHGLGLVQRHQTHTVGHLPRSVQSGTG